MERDRKSHDKGRVEVEDCRDSLGTVGGRPEAVAWKDGGGGMEGQRRWRGRPEAVA